MKSMVYRIVKDDKAEGGFRLQSEVYVKFGNRLAINFVAEGSEEKLTDIKSKLEKL